MKLKEEDICDLTLSCAFLRTIVKLSRGLKEFNEKKVYKLDQETWLCRTHLDDFEETNCTILVPNIPYYTTFHHFW